VSVGERLAVGRVRGIHGLRGAVRVEILTDRPEDRFRRGAKVYREGSEDALTVTSAHADEPGWLVRFAELRDRTLADTLRDAYLEVEIAPGEELPRGEYYWHEVIGTPVLAVDGTVLGTVEDVYRTGGAEVLLVSGGPYGEFDVPAVRAFVRIFAPKRGEIVVDADALELELPKPSKPRGRKSRRAAERATASGAAPAEDASQAEDAGSAEDASPAKASTAAEDASSAEDAAQAEATTRAEDASPAEARSGT
jgi:16S rRNA processing protein RimM